MRFVRKNRALVGVSAGALLALLVIGGSLAISRIVAERDRADDQAQLALAQKTRRRRRDSEKVTDEPAAAHARPRRATRPSESRRARSRWSSRSSTSSVLARGARVAAAARANGVAFALPASPHTLSLELSRDGQRALAAGDDGVVRIYDLAQAHAPSRSPTRRRGDRRALRATASTRSCCSATRTSRSSTWRPARTATSTAPTRDRQARGFGADRVLDRSAARGVEARSRGRRAEQARARRAGRRDRAVARRPVDRARRQRASAARRSHATRRCRRRRSSDGAMRDVAWAADASHLVALIDDEVDRHRDAAVAGRSSTASRSATRRAIAYSNGQHLHDRPDRRRGDLARRLAGCRHVAATSRSASARRAAAPWSPAQAERRSRAVRRRRSHAVGPSPLRIAAIEASPRGAVRRRRGRRAPARVEPRRGLAATRDRRRRRRGAGFVTGDQLDRRRTSTRPRSGSICAPTRRRRSA